MIAKVTSLIPLFFTSCLSQFAMDLGTRADMTFGEDNDRYDVDAIMQDQSSMDMVNQFAYRRLLRRQNEDEVRDAHKVDVDNDIGTKLLEVVKQTVDQLADNSFGHKSDMKPLAGVEDINEEDYEKNIQKFAANGQTLKDKIVVLHGGETSGRRGIPDAENEILFQYGVPVKMKLNGFLQVPLGRK